MKTVRHLVLILFFAGLVSLEVWHGISRIDALSRHQREEVLVAMRRGQEDRARDLAEKLQAEREHAAFLVNLPGARALLQASPEEEPAIRAALQEILLLYHRKFEVIDRLSLFDLTGRERYRQMRQGGGVAALSPELLGAAEGKVRSDLDALAGATGDEVTLSDLEIERDRVYVPERDRQIIRYTAAMRDRTRPLGALVLTLYAAPLLDSVRSWKPRPGVVSSLIDEGGRYIAHPDRRRERGRDAPDTGGSLLEEHARAAGEVLAGAAEARDGDVLLLAAPVAGGLPGWRLVAEVPLASVESSAVPIRGEYAWVIGSMALTSLLLVVAGAFFLRLSIREVRLAEADRQSARYRALMEGAADMILIVAPEREVIREANALARRAFGLPDDGESSLDAVVPSAHRAVFRERLREAAAGGAAALPEVGLRGAEGREIPASGRLAAIDLGDERVVEVALRDLTREKEMERRLRISERLGSLGLLTAGVAHEVNNPLEGIENYLTLLEREGDDPPRRARYLEMVRYGFRRIRDIVRDLSSFARPEVKGVTADLRDVVERALGMVRYDRAFRTVEVERVGFEAPLVVLGDAGRLEQVFINLLVNAGRAMGSRGRIAIAARRAADAAEPFLEVTVDDDGPGIPPELLGRIFDPFFTTGEGTGLGLSISYGIVRAHGGDIRAENRPEGGARFTLRLPAGSAPAASAVDAGGAAAGARRPPEPVTGSAVSSRRSAP